MLRAEPGGSSTTSRPRAHKRLGRRPRRSRPASPFEPPQVGCGAPTPRRERLVGPEAMDHDVVEMVLQVLLHLRSRTGLSPVIFGRYIRRGSRRPRARPSRCSCRRSRRRLEVGVDDLAAVFLSRKGRRWVKATQAFEPPQVAQRLVLDVVETVQGDAFPEVGVDALLHRGQVGEPEPSPRESCSFLRAAWRSPPPAGGAARMCPCRPRRGPVASSAR